MTQVVAEKRWPEEIGIPDTAWWTLRLSLRGMCLMILGFAIISFGLIALTRSTPQPLFAAYSDLLPGQPQSAAEARGFVCRLNTHFDAAVQDCNLHLDTGVFSAIGIITSEGIIRFTAFIVRNGAIKVGDLEASLGKPDIKKYGQTIHFLWFGGRVNGMTFTLNGQLSPFLPLWRISFTEPEPEDALEESEM